MEEGGGGEEVFISGWVGGSCAQWRGAGGGLEWVGLDVKEKKEGTPPLHTHLSHPYM